MDRPYVSYQSLSAKKAPIHAFAISPTRPLTRRFHFIAKRKCFSPTLFLLRLECAPVETEYEKIYPSVRPLGKKTYLGMKFEMEDWLRRNRIEMEKLLQLERHLSNIADLTL